MLMLIVFALQSARYVVHLVSESVEVDSLYPVAQLSLGHSQGNHRHDARRSHRTILLQHAWLYGQKGARSLEEGATLPAAAAASLSPMPRYESMHKRIHDNRM